MAALKPGLVLRHVIPDVGCIFRPVLFSPLNRLSFIRGVLTLPPPCETGTSRSGNRTDQLQSFAEGKFMANLTGLASIVAELRVERTNLANQLKHVDAALSVLGK
jgi:hypothetical protein